LHTVSAGKILALGNQEGSFVLLNWTVECGMANWPHACLVCLWRLRSWSLWWLQWNVQKVILNSVSLLGLLSGRSSTLVFSEIFLVIDIAWQLTIESMFIW